MELDLNRRDLIKLLTATAFTTLQLPAAEPGAPLFFTKHEFAILDTLTELMIPSDDHSPGAREAGVPQYIDRTVAEAFAAEEKTSWRNGLASIDDLSRSIYHTPFLEITAQQQTALLTRLAENEKHPKSKAEKFFTQVKQTTAFAYYSSSIGIHQEMQYQGNKVIQQFAGYDAT